MRIYVSAPATGAGRDDEAMEFAAADLEECGYKVSVPSRFVPKGEEETAARRTCFSELLRCDGVALVDGWKESGQCNQEIDVARSCGIPSAPVCAWLCGASRTSEDRA